MSSLAQRVAGALLKRCWFNYSLTDCEMRLSEGAGIIVVVMVAIRELGRVG